MYEGLPCHHQRANTDWRRTRLRHRIMDLGIPLVPQHADDEQYVHRVGGGDRGDGSRRDAAVAARLLRGGQGSQVYAAYVLHPSVHHLRGDVGGRDPAVRVPRQSAHDPGAGDDRVHPVLRREARVHPRVGRHADLPAVLRRQELQGLERQRSRELLSRGLPGEAAGLQVLAEPDHDVHGRLLRPRGGAAARGRRVRGRRGHRARFGYDISANIFMWIIRENRVTIRRLCDDQIVF